LLDRARLRANDPELFAGLVQALRYCGLLDESIAAYERASRIDPAIRTSVSHAYLARGDYALARAADLDEPPIVTIHALHLDGKDNEALAIVREREAKRLPRLMLDLVTSTRLVLEGNAEEGRPVTERLLGEWRSKDPCAAYYIARQLARAGSTAKALELLARSVANGFYMPTFIEFDPWLDSLRGEAAFGEIAQRAAARHAEARRAFEAADGDRVLGFHR
jgi:tetratricopeptide (TPR) repeat protein